MCSIKCELPEAERPYLRGVASHDVDDIFPEADVGGVALGGQFSRVRRESRPLGAALAEPPDAVIPPLLVIGGSRANQRQFGPRAPGGQFNRVKKLSKNVPKNGSRVKLKRNPV